VKAKQRVHISFRRRVLAAAVTVVVLLVLMWSSKDTTEKKTAKSSPVSNQLRQSALSPTAQATMQQHQSTPASISMSMAEAQLEAHLAAVRADSLAAVEGFKKSAEEAEEVATRTAQDWEQSMQRSSGVTAQHANCSRASDCNHGLVCLRPHRPTVWAGGDRVCMGLEQAAHLRAEAMQALHAPGARARRRAAGDAAHALGMDMDLDGDGQPIDGATGADTRSNPSIFSNQGSVPSGPPCTRTSDCRPGLLCIRVRLEPGRGSSRVCTAVDEAPALRTKLAATRVRTQEPAPAQAQAQRRAVGDGADSGGGNGAGDRSGLELLRYVQISARNAANAAGQKKRSIRINNAVLSAPPPAVRPLNAAALQLEVSVHVFASHITFAARDYLLLTACNLPSDHEHTYRA
jgi:hypothetical protein